MFPVIHQYKLRLTNLSQSNRSLKLSKLSARKDLDLMDLSHLNQLPAKEILEKLIAGQQVALIKALSANDESINLADRRLNKLYHEVETIYEETGTYDLFVGFPFVEGRFLDGSIARCPLVMIPVKLHRNFERSPRWSLQASQDEDLIFNKTFFLAYEKFMQLRMGKEFWEDHPAREQDLQGFLNALYKQVTQQYDIKLHFNPELFQFRIDRFMDKNQALLEQLPIGQLRLVQNAVLGIFPQSDSALLQDYEAMERDPEAFNLEQVFRAQPSMERPQYVKEEDRYFVSQLDQSQEEGLLKVRQGQSLVLHGPPGTGKSQVILNLISDAMARGEKVLVCSQKRAALDVVYQRLAEHGLSRFVALIHDFRDDRSKIFAKIRQQIDEIPKFMEENRDFGIELWLREHRLDSRALDEQSQFFEQLHAGLSQVGRFGLSMHELYLLADKQGPWVDMAKVAPLFDFSSAKVFQAKLREILGYAEFFANQHPWKFRKSFSQIGLGGKDQLRKQVQGLQASINELHESFKALQGPGKSVVEASQTAQAIADFLQLDKQLRKKGVLEDLEAALTMGWNRAQLEKELSKLAKLLLKLQKFELLDGLPLSIASDILEQLDAYKAGKGKVSRLFSKKWLKSWWYMRSLLARKKLSLSDSAIGKLENEAKTLRALLKLGLEWEDRPYFESIPLGDTTEALAKWLEGKQSRLEALDLYHDFKQFPSLRPGFKESKIDQAHWELMVKEVELMQSLLNKRKAMEQNWQSWLHPKQMGILQKGVHQPELAHKFIADLQFRLEADFEELLALDNLMARLSPAEQQAMAHLEPVLDELKASQVGSLPAAAMNGFLQAWIGIAEAANPFLADVSLRGFEQRQESYQRLLKKRQSTVASLIQRKLKDQIVERIEFNRLNNPVTYREIGHQVRKQRQLWSVRKLVSAFWEDGLGQLLPCWMASPESVAAIFPMVKDYFDLVIFDEASQCYVERALPVMLRGKQVVVAGDDKQLPPFDLYNVKVEEDEDGFSQDEMALEVESVLDLARNLFTECKLSWHYRSLEEELINFSNHAFYEGRLNIVPAARHEAISRPPISFIQVPGLWEKNSNALEAAKVVELVEELVMRPEQPSIGIVTFNYHQKELIWEMLEQRQEQLSAEKNVEVLQKLQEAMNRGEGEERQGIFVKNIENVQGDERDVIIFSIGYAKDAKGRMVANFGLLNQKGGGNRLNVAITRAKKKGIVVCSFLPEDLRVEDAKHEGPKLLKAYLQFARAVSEGNAERAAGILKGLGGLVEEDERMQSKASIPRGALAERLAARLKDAGLDLELGLGDTQYKLDMALKDQQGNYLLGIECEGANYFSGKSSKEREIYRPSALKDRGWKVHRLWARNFYLDPEKEVAKIMEKIGKTED